MHNNQILGEENYKVLRILQEVLSPAAIIAGGAVRDLALKRPYKDVDVLIPFNKKKSMAKELECDLPYLLKFGDADYIDIKTTNSEPITAGDSREAPFIRDVFDMIYQGTTYQLLIVRDEPKRIIERYFDFNLNRAYHDGNAATFMLGFDEDLKNKTLTYDVSNMDTANIKKIELDRGPKLLKRLPDFKLNRVGKVLSVKQKILRDFPELEALPDYVPAVRQGAHVGILQDGTSIALTNGWYGPRRGLGANEEGTSLYHRGDIIPDEWVYV